MREKTLKTNKLRWLVLLLAAGLASMLIGCGPSRHEVKGEIINTPDYYCDTSNSQEKKWWEKAINLLVQKKLVGEHAVLKIGSADSGKTVMFMWEAPDATYVNKLPVEVFAFVRDETASVPTIRFQYNLWPISLHDDKTLSNRFLVSESVMSATVRINSQQLLTQVSAPYMPSAKEGKIQ